MTNPAWRSAYTLFRTHLYRRLRYLHRVLNDRMNTELTARGYRGLTDDSIKVLAYLGVEGTTAATLAREHGVPRQTMSRMVNQACDAGYLRKAPDPEDTRAFRLLATTSGIAMIRDAFDIGVTIEAELAKRIGTADYRELTTLTDAVFRHMGLVYPRSAQHVTAARTSPPRLQIQLHAICTRARLQIAERSFDVDARDLADSHWNLLEQIPEDGTRAADLAQATDLSKQRVSAVVKQLVGWELLHSEPDPADRRVNRLHFTDRARSLIAHRMADTRVLLTELRLAIGTEPMDRLELHAGRLFQLLGGVTPAPLPHGDDAVDALVGDWLALLHALAHEHPTLDTSTLFDEAGNFRPRLFEALLRRAAARPKD